MRAAICLVVTAAALCAGCDGTEPAASSNTAQVAETATSDKPKPLSQRRSFFGTALGDGAKKVVFVIDRSGSMTDAIDYVKLELKRSIGELDEADAFHVLFFSSGPPVEMRTRRLVHALRHNKALAGEFIDGVVPGGETDPVESIKRAFAVRPEIIYLLTDGDFDRSLVDLVKRLNTDKCVKVNTTAFLYGPHVVLKEIAQQTGGTYRFLAEADLARMVPP